MIHEHGTAAFALFLSFHFYQNELAGMAISKCRVNRRLYCTYIHTYSQFRDVVIELVGVLHICTWRDRRNGRERKGKESAERMGWGSDIRAREDS